MSRFTAAHRGLLLWHWRHSRKYKKLNLKYWVKHGRTMLKWFRTALVLETETENQIITDFSITKIIFLCVLNVETEARTANHSTGFYGFRNTALCKLWLYINKLLWLVQSIQGWPWSDEPRLWILYVCGKFITIIFICIKLSSYFCKEDFVNL